MKVASGVDMIEIERMSQIVARHGRRFLERVFTPGELEDARHNPASLAARFAAKEAVAKALGTGIGPVAWREIEIRRGPAREPILILHGNAQALAEQLGLQTWSISLSHTEKQAIATAVAVGE